METLSQTLRDKADQFLIQNGVLEHAFLDLRQVPPNEALKKWLSAGNAGSMQWIKRTEDKRINALTAFPQFPSALLCSLSYYDIENVKNS